MIPAGSGETYLSLRLLNVKPDVTVPRLSVPVSAASPLSTFAGLIEELLSLGGPDASVQLWLISGADQSPRLVIRRFAAETELWDGAVRLAPRREGRLRSPSP